MTASLSCDMCGDEPAVTMVTNLANGDTVAIGEACHLTFHLAVAAELLGNMPAEAAFEYAAMADRIVTAIAGASTPSAEDQSREAARAQYGDLCPECGIAWDQPSPDCPHEIWNLHPLPDNERSADVPAETPQYQPVATEPPVDDTARTAQRPRRGNNRRPV